jgi:sec-independent protein translocase protein TatA
MVNVLHPPSRGAANAPAAITIMAQSALRKQVRSGRNILKNSLVYTPPAAATGLPQRANCVMSAFTDGGIFPPVTERGMFGLGTTELILILIIVIVLFGAKRLPQVGAGLAKGIKSFRSNIADDDKSSRDDDPASADSSEEKK